MRSNSCQNLRIKDIVRCRFLSSSLRHILLFHASVIPNNDHNVELRSRTLQSSSTEVSVPIVSKHEPPNLAQRRSVYPRFKMDHNHMDMSSTGMAMGTPTASGAMASSTGMSMGGPGSSCKISVSDELPHQISPDLTQKNRCCGTGIPSTHVSTSRIPRKHPLQHCETTFAPVCQTRRQARQYVMSQPRPDRCLALRRTLYTNLRG